MPTTDSGTRAVASVVGMVVLSVLFAILAVVLLRAGFRGGDGEGAGAERATFTQEVEIDGTPMTLYVDTRSLCIGAAGGPDDASACGAGGVAEGEFAVAGQSFFARLAIAGSDMATADLPSGCRQEWTDMTGGFVATWCLR